MKRQYSLLITLFLFLTPIFPYLPVSGQSSTILISSANTSLHINENGTSDYSNILHIELLESLNSLSLEINALLSDVKTSINGSPSANAVFQDNSHTEITITSAVPLNQGDLIEVSITSNIDPKIDEIDDNSFQIFFDWSMGVMPETTNISITLPQGMIISQTQGSNNIFPTPDDIDSDGQQIIVSWTNRLGSSQNTQLFVQYQETSSLGDHSITTVTESGSVSNSSNPLTVAVLVVLLLITTALASYFYYLIYIQDQADEGENKETTTPESEDDENNVKIVKVIKPVVLSRNEMDVLSLISEAGGAINQSELVDLLDVSKARVSQYLSDFEDRNLIIKEKMGRQNLIKLNIDAQDLQS